MSDKNINDNIAHEQNNINQKRQYVGKLKIANNNRAKRVNDMN